MHASNLNAWRLILVSLLNIWSCKSIHGPQSLPHCLKTFLVCQTLFVLHFPWHFLRIIHNSWTGSIQMQPLAQLQLRLSFQVCWIQTSLHCGWFCSCLCNQEIFQVTARLASSFPGAALLSFHLEKPQPISHFELGLLLLDLPPWFPTIARNNVSLWTHPIIFSQALWLYYVWVNVTLEMSESTFSKMSESPSFLTSATQEKTDDLKWKKMLNLWYNLRQYLPSFLQSANFDSALFRPFDKSTPRKQNFTNSVMGAGHIAPEFDTEEFHHFFLVFTV